MIYTEEFFINKGKEINKLLLFLEDCKFSGSWDTKIDLNVIIKNLTTYKLVVDELRKEIKNLELKISSIEKLNEADNEQT